jgi:hypothetical protein
MATLDDQVKNSLGMLAPDSPDNVLLRTGDSSPAGSEGAFGGGPLRRLASGVGDVINNLTETRYSGGVGPGMQSPVPSAQQLGKVNYTPSSATTTPTPKQPSIASVITPAAGMGGPSNSQIETWRDQDRTEAVKAGMGAVGEQPFYGKSVDANGNPVLTARGGTPSVPAGMGSSQDIESQIQQLVDKVSSTSKFDELFATKLKAGMLTNVLKEKGELEKANIMGKYGLESAKLRRGELDEIARGNLDARIAHNKVLEQDLQLRLAQQKDVAQQKLAESHYQKFVAQEIDPMTGKTVNNELHTLLNMGNSGLPVPEAFQPAVERAMAGFETYYKKGLSPGAKDTPLNRMKAMQAYKKHTSLLSESK